MNDSLFENILRKKSLGFKPTVAPDIFTGVKAGLKTSMKTAASTSGKIAGFKAAVTKATYSIAVKAVVGVTSLATVATGSYILIDSNVDKTEIETKNELIKIGNSNLLYTELLNTNQEQVGLANMIKMNGNDQPTLQKRGTASPINKDEDELITEGNANVMTKQSSGHFVTDLPKENSNSIKAITPPDLIKEKGLTNPLNINKSLQSFDKASQSETQKKASFIKKIDYSISMSVGKSYLLKEGESSDDHSEESTGSFTSGSLGLYYKLNDRMSFGLKAAYQQIDILSQFFSEGQKDGEINRKLNLIKSMLGLRYRLYTKNKWHANVLSHVGCAYKLKHDNEFSGIYFQKSFTSNLKEQNKLSPTADLSVNLSYDINKNIAIGASLHADYIHFDSNSSTLNTGGQFTLSYKW